MTFPWPLWISSIVLAGIIFGLGVPLTLGKVPPNGTYGFRTQKTMRDSQTWYRANAFGGKALMVCGSAIALLSLLLLLMRALGVADAVLNKLFVPFELGPIAVLAIVTIWYNAKL